MRHSVTKNNEGALDNDLIFRRYISITPFGTSVSLELLITITVLVYCSILC